jgi:hypothetical protein
MCEHEYCNTYTVREQDAFCTYTNVAMFLRV